MNTNTIIGHTVTHQGYGTGTIISVENNRITVNFDSVGVKKLQFPQVFLKLLTLDDTDLQKEVLAEARKLEAEKENKRKEEEAQRQLQREKQEVERLAAIATAMASSRKQVRSASTATRPARIKEPVKMYGDLHMKDNSDVIALAVGNTYDIVIRTSVTAHPARAPFPRGDFSLLIPIQKGGYMEELYNVLTIVECLPQDVEKQRDLLTAEQYAQLQRYHAMRSKTFGYSDVGGIYRFYILSKKANIVQPFRRKNIQISVKLNSSEIPLA